MGHGLKVQLVTPYRVSHLQRYGITIRGNVTSVDPPSDALHARVAFLCKRLADVSICQQHNRWLTFHCHLINQWNTHVRDWITATSCKIMLGDAKVMNEDI